MYPEFPENEPDSWLFPEGAPPAPAFRPPPSGSPAASGAALPRSNRRHGLTLRQNAFCEHFVATGNAALAAREAGYSTRAARYQGHRLSKDPRVQARVRALQSALADTIEPGMILGRLEHLYRLAAQSGRYGSAAYVLSLIGRSVGLDRRGMALPLLSRNQEPERADEAPRAAPFRLPSAVESMRRVLAANGRTD